MKNWQRFIGVVLVSLSLVLGRGYNSVAQANPTQLVRQAQQQYDLGQSVRALTLLERAATIYQSRSALLPQIQILTLTSLVQQQQRNWQLASQNLERSQTLIDTLPPSKSKTQVQAQIWNVRGHYALATGKSAQALDNWQEAERLYREINDIRGIAGTNLDAAEALNRLGFHRRACDRALSSLNLEQNRCQDLDTEALALIIRQAGEARSPWLIDSFSTMANSLLSMGKLLLARDLAIANQHLLAESHLVKSSTQAKIDLSWGNIELELALQAKAQSTAEDFQFHQERAHQYYQRLKNLPPGFNYDSFRLAAQLNELSLNIASQQWLQANQLAARIQLSPLSDDLYASLQFANSLRLLQSHPAQQYDVREIANLYLNVAQQAELAGDSRAESYAWGNLGELATETRLALKSSPQQMFERALWLAQSISAPELSYRWQWRLGRIYRQQGARVKAIASYQAALANLDSLRSDLVALEKEVRYEFKANIEPVYRELADLLLTGSPSQSDLVAAQNAIEALQLAELDNYFQDACLTFEPKSIDRVDAHGAIIHTIILPDRLEIVVATVDRARQQQILHHYSQSVSQEHLEATIIQLRQYLTEPDRTRDIQRLSAQIYHWLIQPLEVLEQESPQTLVFVLDGLLQTIPMAVLYDGKQYLLEKYAIALTPGLRLLNLQKNSASPSFLAGGISRSLQVGQLNFPPLTNVPDEIAAVEPLDNALLNQQFTPENLSTRLNRTSTSVVHLATHGQFRANPRETFLLMWQKLLTIDEFSRILQTRRPGLEPIELLVLSACDTATGDRRSALGLAGIAVRSGALSTLATLWQIDDRSTAQLMRFFYQYLPHHTKAEALRQAQLELWRQTNRDWEVPAFWSAYVIIGDWQ
ncbi:MAG: CHAT domain-containing protein [Cyanobacteria bacterium J06623_7]